MSIYKSVTDTTLGTQTGYTAMFTHDRGSELKVVKDPLINSDELGSERAKVELVKGAYAERVINVTSIHKPEIVLNSVFSFNGALWIAKTIEITFKSPSLFMTIKGVRYE